jgi:hypothetical protein
MFEMTIKTNLSREAQYNLHDEDLKSTIHIMVPLLGAPMLVLRLSSHKPYCLRDSEASSEELIVQGCFVQEVDPFIDYN